MDGGGGAGESDSFIRHAFRILYKIRLSYTTYDHHHNNNPLGEYTAPRSLVVARNFLFRTHPRNLHRTRILLGPNAPAGIAQNRRRGNDERFRTSGFINGYVFAAVYIIIEQTEPFRSEFVRFLSYTSRPSLYGFRPSCIVTRPRNARVASASGGGGVVPLPMARKSTRPNTDRHGR